MTDPTPTDRRSPLEHERDSDDLHDAVTAERDALKAEVERLEAMRREDVLQRLADMGQMAEQIGALATERDALKAEVERLRALDGGKLD